MIVLSPMLYKASAAIQPNPCRKDARMKIDIFNHFMPKVYFDRLAALIPGHAVVSAFPKIKTLVDVDARDDRTIKSEDTVALSPGQQCGALGERTVVREDWALVAIGGWVTGGGGEADPGNRGKPLGEWIYRIVSQSIA